MLLQAELDYPSLEERGNKFDAELMADMVKVGGEDYGYLTSLVFRQTIAAHKLVADVDGTPMLFSKENDSNGCIDTVDVTYPSSPFFLLFNPELLKAQLEPLMRYAALPRWRFPFAPHDLGTYPLANGQVYGGGETNEVDQMPVEESGNLILMIAALERSEGNWDFARRYLPQLTKWAAYLADKGLDPENQLSTDDFAGHLAHNTNLSIKAIEALGAFVEIAKNLGDNDLAERYEKIVRPMPARWEEMARDGDHYKLAFDQNGTWSQKYNLVWDRILNLHLFPAKNHAGRMGVLFRDRWNRTVSPWTIAKRLPNWIGRSGRPHYRMIRPSFVTYCIGWLRGRIRHPLACLPLISTTRSLVNKWDSRPVRWSEVYSSKPSSISRLPRNGSQSFSCPSRSKWTSRLDGVIWVLNPEPRARLSPPRSSAQGV